MEDQDTPNVIPDLQLMVATQCIRAYLGSPRIDKWVKYDYLDKLLAPTEKQASVPRVPTKRVYHYHHFDDGCSHLCSDRTFPTLSSLRDDGTIKLYLVISKSLYDAFFDERRHIEGTEELVSRAESACQLDTNKFERITPYTYEIRHLDKVWLTQKMQLDILNRYIIINKNYQREYILKVYYRLKE